MQTPWTFLQLNFVRDEKVFFDDISLDFIFSKRKCCIMKFFSQRLKPITVSLILDLSVTPWNLEAKCLTI